MSRDGPVDVLMAVHNGEAWLADVLESLATQTMRDFRLTVWDNASTDGTVEVIERVAPFASVVQSDENIGFWAAIEELSAKSTGEAILALTDVQLAPEFLERSWAAFSDSGVGAVQGKLYQLRDGGPTTIIDTVGFSIDRARRVTITGHGEVDLGQYDLGSPIFAAEGAAPMFRAQAFREAAVDGHVVDPAFRRGPLGYGDDLDVAWRLSLFGWRQVLVPDAVGWHDRSTTHDTAAGLRSHLGRVRQRQAIPLEKRILDWANVRATRLKNDRAVDMLRDLPFIVARELTVLGYMLLFEPRALAALGRFARLVRPMMRQRRTVQARARGNLGQWFI